MNLIKFLHSRAFFLLFALASAGALLGAFTAQYGLGMAPCHLCLLQRYPHALVVAISIACYFYLPEKHHKYAYALLSVTLATGMAIAIKHVGVEAGWLESSCVATMPSGLNLEDIRARIMAAPRVSCDQAAATLFGVSMAGWNALYSGVLALLALYQLMRRKSHATSR
jgi:disulfide bond formation protein DsbB